MSRRAHPRIRTNKYEERPVCQVNVAISNRHKEEPALDEFEGRFRTRASGKYVVTGSLASIMSNQPQEVSFKDMRKEKTLTMITNGCNDSVRNTDFSVAAIIRTWNAASAKAAKLAERCMR